MEDDDNPFNDITEQTVKPKMKNNKNHNKTNWTSCEPLSNETFVNIEVVKYGKETNESYSAGTIVKITCDQGYGLNIPGNKTAKCVRGKWRPATPNCLISKHI